MKRIVTYVIAFILMLSIIACIVIQTVRTTILNKEYIISKMEENNYYESVKTNIQSSFEGYIQQSGLEEEVITDLFSIDEVKNDTGILLSNIYTNENQKIDTEKIKSRLRDKIYTSLADVKLKNDDKKSIEEFVDIIADTYKNEIEHTDWLGKLNGKVYKLSEILNIANIALYVLPIILILILIVAHKKDIYRAIDRIGISFVGSGVLIIGLTIFIKMNIDIPNILILNEAISIVIRSTIHQILNILTITSVIFEAIGIIACFIANYIKLKKIELI